MPNYGYRCQSCDAEFEIVQRMSDPAVATCPTCGGAGTRLFYPAGIVFKGSGFYKTDSRPGSSPAKDASPVKPASTTPAEPAKSGTATPASSNPAPSPPASSSPSTAKGTD